ncbi:MAG TPA: glycerol kinase GlpK [Solirubrobacteraceae bacterium]|nr:glycerol kinase GlpK [Solirubrobacteraceae bacterium]
MTRFVAAIDQGTTSTRCALVGRDGQIAALARREHEQITPRPGWVEHDPRAILANALETIEQALREAAASAADVVAVGIANQRETTVVWERETGEPIANAIVWQDTRTAARLHELAADGGAERLRERTGLPLSTYFSGPKASWLLDSIPGARARGESGELAFGTIDAWLATHLAGVHATDVTNASRTLLMDLETLDWHEPALELLGVPRAMLPAIGASSEVIGEVAVGALAGCPLAGILGDQQAALFGQRCFDSGDAKNTYGTGSFLLVNTGERIVRSPALLTSVAYRLAGAAAVYALEGSVAVAGGLVQWLRDQLGIIASAAEIESLARGVPDNGGVYIVPAFAGLFAPHWRDDARGVIVGLTAHAGRGQLARAALEAVAWQTRDVVEAVEQATGAPLAQLRVDGGMTENELLMQIQADVLATPVLRPQISETTVLGAAFAAGLATGFWSGLDELRSLATAERRYDPAAPRARIEREHARWRAALERSLGWEA